MSKTKLIKQSEKGAISFEGNTLTNLGAPTQPNDAVRKTEVDSKLAISDFEIEKGNLETKDNTLQNQIDNIISDLGEVQVEANTNTLTNTLQQDQIDKNNIDITLNEIKIINNEQKDKQQDLRLSALEDVVESFFEDDAIIVNDGPVNLTNTPTNFTGTIEKQFDEIDVNEVINQLDATVIEIKPGNIVKGEIGMGLTFTKVPLKESFTFVMEAFNYLTGETETYINEDGVEKPIRYTTNFEWPAGVSTFTTEYKFFKSEFDEGTRAIRYYTGNPGEEVNLEDITVGVINKATEVITGDITNSGDLTDVSTVGGATVEESLDILNSGKVNGINGTIKKLTDLNPLEFVERDGIISVGNGYNDTLSTTSKTFVGAINEKLNIKRDFSSTTSGISGTIDNTNAQTSGSSYTETYLGQMKSLTGAAGTTEANIGLRVDIDGRVNAIAKYKDSSGTLVPVDTTLSFGLATKEYVDTEVDTKVDKKWDISNNTNDITGFLDRAAEESINLVTDTFITTEQVESIEGAGTLTEINRRFNINVDGTFDYEVFGRTSGAVPSTPKNDWSMTPKKYVDDKVDDILNILNALVPIGTIQLGTTAPTFGTWADLGILAAGESIIGSRQDGDGNNTVADGTSYSGSVKSHNHIWSTGYGFGDGGGTARKFINHLTTYNSDDTETSISDSSEDSAKNVYTKKTGSSQNIAYGKQIGYNVHVWKRTA